MHLILFAMIGAYINADVWYWIVYGIYALTFFIRCVKETIEEVF